MPDINWNEPLETDEPTPRRVSPATVEASGYPRAAFGGVIENGGKCLWEAGGKALYPGFPSIRNVRSLRTADEALQRMEALVRRLAGAGDVADMTAEAREIVALLPEPVDPDIAEARRIANETSLLDVDAAILAGIKRGRALAAS